MLFMYREGRVGVISSQVYGPGAWVTTRVGRVSTMQFGYFFFPNHLKISYWSIACHGAFVVKSEHFVVQV